MLITFIIIAENEVAIKTNMAELKNAIAKADVNSEIIMAFGDNPSRQRNEAVKKASGEWIYFLDNDSLIDLYTIKEFLISIERYPDAIVVGGPSVLKDSTNIWQNAIQLVFSSDFGVGPLRSRYFSNGQIRVSNEKELILCNMAILKSVFLRLNGFNEELYPNEENEFLSRISEHGKIIYSPLMFVLREHRDGVFSFFKQMKVFAR